MYVRYEVSDYYLKVVTRDILALLAVYLSNQHIHYVVIYYRYGTACKQYDRST